MAILYFAYLFDAPGFRDKLRPVIPQVEAGNYEPLYRLAKDTVERKPELWRLLDDLFLGPPLEELDEEISSHQRLLTIIQMNYVQPIPAPAGFGWMFLHVTLPLIGWSEAETRQLLFGRSLCGLITPVSARTTNSQRDDRWCAGQVDWLDVETVDRFHDRLLQAQAAYHTFVDQPNTSETVVVAAGFLPGYPLTADNLKQGLADLTAIFALAHEARQALAMVVA